MKQRVGLAVVVCLASCLAMGRGQEKKEPKEDPKEVLKRLLKQLDSEDLSERHEALLELEYFGPEAAPALPKLIKALASDNEETRMFAANAIGKIGKAAVAPLSELLDAKDDNTRYYAIQALG